MNKNSLILPIGLILIILLPNSLGRFLIDLTGSILIFSLVAPILIAGLGWILWKIIQLRTSKCSSCGTTYFGNLQECPLCGVTQFDNQSSDDTVPASDKTIDVTVEEIE